MRDRPHILGAFMVVLLAWCSLAAAGACSRPGPPPVPEASAAHPEPAPPPALEVEPEPLPGTTTASPAAPDSAPYCGARDSKVFHRCDADHVHLIKPENLVRWKSREEAVAAGRHPCKLCNP